MKDETVLHERIDFLECYFIKLFDTMNRNKGYNCESGGNLNKTHSKDTIERMKVANKIVVQNIKVRSGNYKGVSWDKEKEKWCTRLKYNYNTIFLGYYDNEIEAAKNYNDYALYLNNTLKTQYSINEIQDYIPNPRDIPKETREQILNDKSCIYNGVTFVKKRNNYQASIKYKNSLFLGSSKIAIEAAKLYNQQALYFNNTFKTKYILNNIENYVTIPKNIHEENKNNKIKSSKYIGVISYKNTKWRSKITLNKKQIYLGTFEIELDAAKIYNTKAKEFNNLLNKQQYKLNEL